MKKGVSLSTLRRHIKAEKIEYKLEHGKYLVWCDENANGRAAQEHAAMYERAAQGRAAQERVSEDGARLQGKLDKLERELKKAQQEIAELKMLVALYEEGIPSKKHGK